MHYDDQAADFDRRAGLPDGVAKAIADALAAVTALRPGMTLLEIGVGTGIVSQHLVALPIHYIGFDRSAAMLDVFGDKLRNAGADISRCDVITTDGNDDWPVRDHEADIVFSVRALHQLETDHAVSEILRVVSEGGGWLVAGHVERPRDSVKARLRRRMHQLLEDEGLHGRSHRRREGRLFEALVERGAGPIDEQVVASWTRPLSPAEAIDASERKQGLSGNDLPPDVHRRIFDRWRAWAAEEFGDLSQPLALEESFVLTSVKIPPGPRI